MDGARPDTLPIPQNGDENVGGLIIAFAWWTTAVTFVFVTLRLIATSIVAKNRLWWDDWHIVAAELATIAGAGLVTAEVGYGFGRHAHYLSIDDVSNYLSLSYASWIVTFFTLMSTKISVCFFLLKLPATSRVRRPLWVAIAVIFTSNVAFILLWILQCVPPNAAWQFDVNATCLSRQAVSSVILAQAITSAVCDYSLALYPLIIIFKLRLSRKQSIGLCVLMGLGVLVGSCCVVRAFLNGQAVADDATYTTVANWFWRLFEVQLGIVCACIPALIPLYEWLRDKITGEKRSSLTSIMNAFPNPSNLELPNVQKMESHTAHSDATPSEKAYLGQAANFDSQDIEALMLQRPLPPVPLTGQGSSTDLRTFWSDDSREEVADPKPRYRPAPPAMVDKNVSFSTRDRIRHPAIMEARPPPTSMPPQVFITSPHGHPEEPRSPSFEDPRGVPRRPTVRVTSQQGLDVDLTPSFQRNRGAFGRILGVERSSWRSSFMSSYSSRGNNRARIGERDALI